MNHGYLIVSVYFNDVATPVEGAKVNIKGEGANIDLLTDESGKTNKIKLNTPVLQASLVPQYEVKPYATYELTVEKTGYKPVIITGVEVFPTETSLQSVYMHQEDGTGPEYINLPEHELWEPSAGKDQYMHQTDDNLERVLPRVIIPEYVIVHDGAPTANATRHVVSFRDYIKNVTSSEIFSTWPVESIKANVHAIVSFTLNRYFTEWYKSRGHAFTITSSPAFDQKYTHNRTIFQSISNVVDEYFRYFIRLGGTTHPFFAQYNDGIKTNIKGRLSQWGSKEMADRGSSAIQILRHFYTNNLSLVVGHEMIGLPNSFPGFNLSVGTCGEYVQKAQIELNRIRTHYPAIPAIQPADGRYQDSTRRAVEAFQRIFNLPVRGVIDFATWFEISRVFTAVARLSAGV